MNITRENIIEQYKLHKPLHFSKNFDFDGLTANELIDKINQFSIDNSISLDKMYIEVSSYDEYVESTITYTRNRTPEELEQQVLELLLKHEESALEDQKRFIAKEKEEMAIYLKLKKKLEG